MYNKLFTKILDSSIWLEPPGTRIVWLTLIAAMDEDGFTQFASVANLAHRARIPENETADAVNCLESPDPNSSDPDFEGRRIERVPGGWVVLNAQKYRELVTRTVQRERTRLRVQKHRQKSPRNASVTPRNERVTQSEAFADTEEQNTFERFWSLYPKKMGKADAKKAWSKVPESERGAAIKAIQPHVNSQDWKKEGGKFIPWPQKYLNHRRWEDELIPAIPEKAYFYSPDPDAGRDHAEVLREKLLALPESQLP